jgi:crotonobetainyl-CoA:carnitine CoA-transferase CaiB-like acyl-CoA transferase
VRSLEEALNAPEVIEAGLIQTLDHPTAGELRTLRSPIGLPGSPDRQDLPPPLLGEHTDEILKNVLGLNDSEVAGLRSDEVVA